MTAERDAADMDVRLDWPGLPPREVRRPLVSERRREQPEPATPAPRRVRLRAGDGGSTAALRTELDALRAEVAELREQVAVLRASVDRVG